MNRLPKTASELRDLYDGHVSRLGKAKAVSAIARAYDVSPGTVHRYLADAGIRPIREKVCVPAADELRAVYEAAVAEFGERASVTKVAAKYDVTTVTIRKWLGEIGLYERKARAAPPRPITTPCPCGAKATTRYKDQDPPLCFKCYMRTYASDGNSGFRRTAREYILEVKREAPCADCGNQFPPCCMHFDHVPERGQKLFNLGNGDYSIDAVKAEMAKCDIVCANCHAIRTWITREKPWLKRDEVAAVVAAAPDGMLF